MLAYRAKEAAWCQRDLKTNCREYWSHQLLCKTRVCALCTCSCFALTGSPHSRCSLFSQRFGWCCRKTCILFKRETSFQTLWKFWRRSTSRIGQHQAWPKSQSLWNPASQLLVSWWDQPECRYLVFFNGPNLWLNSGSDWGWGLFQAHQVWAYRASALSCSIFEVSFRCLIHSPRTRAPFSPVTTLFFRRES